jgi:tol-pal system protein YbgF
VRKQWMLSMGAALVAGAVGGALVSPSPLGAVAKEIVEIMSGVNSLQQGQRDMQSSLDTRTSELRTLIQQQSDNSGKLAASVNAMQKTVQDMEANSGSTLNNVSTSVQGVSDNLTELQGRLSKLSQQVVEVQNSLQSLDSKVAALQPSAPAASGTNPGTMPAGTTPATSDPNTTAAPPANPAPSGGTPNAAIPSGDMLYNNALNDVRTGKYDLAQQECRDYLKYYPIGPYASNAHYYLGDIARVQQRWDDAIDQYTTVITKYPDSFKLPGALYYRGVSYLAVKRKAPAVADFQSVVHKFPRSPEDSLSRAKLKELGVPPATTTKH